MNGQLKMNLVVMAAASAYLAFGSAEFFVVEKNPEWTSDGSVCQFVMRDGTPAPVGLRMQGLSGNVTNVFPPPESVASRKVTYGRHVYGVATPVNIRECRAHMFVVGEDGVRQGYPAGPGCASAFIEGDDDWHGCIRAFSAKRISDAAYYGDTEIRMLETLGEFNDSWNCAAFTIDKVNPAYQGLQFDVFPVLTEEGSVTGSVNTTSAGGNNVLDNARVAVTYSTDEGVTWQPLKSLEIKDDGDFSGTYEAAGLPLVRIEGLSARAGLPNSGEGVAPVPEPAMVVILLCLAGLFSSRAANRTRA